MSTTPSKTPSKITNVPTAGLFIIGTLAVLVGLWSGYQASSSHSPAPPPEISGTILPSPRPLQAFSLVDQNNQTFTLAQFRDHWSFIFFGYTHCPDVCPTTMLQFQSIAKQLQQQAKPSQAPQFIFVSVDPERDKPEQLKQYVEFYNPNFKGVTGTENELKRFARQLGAVFGISKTENKQDYLVDHSAAILLIDPQARLSTVFSAPHNAKQMAIDFQEIIQYAKK